MRLHLLHHYTLYITHAYKAHTLSLSIYLSLSLSPDLAAVVDLFRGWDADGSGALDEGEFAEGPQKK